MESERKVLELNLDDILPNRFQPRIKFNETAIEELAESIKEHGVIQPIVVRPLADKYEIIAGERRYKASLMAGKTTIPAIVTSMNDKESAEVALIENVQRQDLTPIEEAVSYQKILDMGYLTQEQLANKLGRNQSTIANKLRLLNLDDEVQEALLNGSISERHARSLLKLSDYNKQKEMLKRIIDERLTVRKTDQEIDAILNKDEKKVEEMNNKVEEIPTVNNDINNSTQANGTINPGFMDVDKIEHVAKDIYQEKPLANLDSLLSGSSTPSQPVNSAPEMPQAEDDDSSLLRPGKFFNLFPAADEEETPAVNQAPVMPDILSPSMPQVAPTPVSEPVETIPVTPQPFTVPSSEPVEPPKEEPTPVATPITPSSYDTFKAIYDNLSAPEQPKEEVAMTMPEVDNVLSTQNSTPAPLQPEPTNYTNNLPQEPIIESPKPEMPVVTNMDTKDEDPELFDPFAAEEIKEEPKAMPVYNNFLHRGEEIELQPTEKETATIKVADMRTVINTIRDCAKTIESYGFVIDTEELDFENTYQVVFTINKK